MKRVWIVALTIVLATLTAPVEAQILVEIPIDFDPPCVFENGIPLQLAHYLSPATNAIFLVGNGVVLHTCAGFNIEGFSPPNFMAWNCNATNGDGSVPALPEAWMFGIPVSVVSVNVGSGTNTGEEASLIALDQFFNIIAADTVVLTNTLQTLTTVAPDTLFAVLVGPCVMVADDFSSTIEIPLLSQEASESDGNDPRFEIGANDTERIRQLVRDAVEKRNRQEENQNAPAKTIRQRR